MYRKMLDVMKDVRSEVAERDELIELIAIALLTRKNLFILGDTGQAKSYAINEFRKRIQGAKQFERLLSKQTDEEALFGRIDLQSLLAGQPRMITTGKIPDSHIVFTDEIFKSNEAVLNSLLTALNERRYTNEGETVDIPVISFFSASNEIPNFTDPAEKILLPLYDRFELKIVTKYIESRDARLSMLVYKQFSGDRGIGASITLDEIYAMQEEVSQVELPFRIHELMDDILCELRLKGIHVSDRKYFGYTPIVRAKAYLSGRTVAEPADMLVLENYLWTKPEQIEVIRQTLERLCVNPLEDKLNSFMTMAHEAFGEWAADEDTAELRKLKDEFIRIYDMAVTAAAEASSAAETRMAEEFFEKLDETLKRAYDRTNLTFVPLAELKLFV